MAMGRDVLGKLLGAGYDRILTDGYDRAMCLNIGHVGDGRGAFGVVAQTVRSWLGDLWDLWGDGSTPVGDAERQLILREALVQGGFGSEPHLPAMLGRYVSRVSGLPGYRNILVVKRPDGLTDAESRLLDCLGTYRDRLAELGAIEMGEAQIRLADAIKKNVILKRAIETKTAYLSDAPMPPDLAAFFEESGLGETLDVLDPEGEPYRFEEPVIHGAPEGLGVSFAFPSGTYAQPQLLIGLVEDALPRGPVTITAKDPLALYESIVPGLSSRGIRCAVSGSKPFARTSLGAAYLALHEFLSADSAVASESQLADVMTLPFLEIDEKVRWNRDKTIRCDKLIDRDRMLEKFFDTGEASGQGGKPARSGIAVALFHRLVSEPNSRCFEDLKSAIDRWWCPKDAPALGCTRGMWKVEQKNALDRIKALYDVAHRLGIPDGAATDSYVELLRQSTVPVAYANYGDKAGLAPEVLVVDQGSATAPAPNRPATLIACDLDGASYPAAEREDACSRLLYGKLGLDRGEEYLPRMRRLWNGLVDAPTETFVALRRLNDFDGDPTYPCAMLEEFVDTYRDLDSEDALKGDDLDGTFLLPKGLLSSVVTRGEGDLFQDVLAGVAAPGTVAVPDEAADRGWIASHDENGRIVISPSKVDTYRACPYLWFITGRLDTKGIDEELDPLSRGTFYHLVFKTFYERMKRADMPKVTPSNLTEAHAVMERTFQSIVKEQRERDLEGKSDVGNRYVAKPGTTESSELDFIRGNVHAWVESQSRFLPDERLDGVGWHFVPAEFELDISDCAVDYATARLRGRIDRIDVDADREEAVVVDYKGGLGTRYDVGGAGFAGKALQGLIYGAVIRSTPELRRRLGLGALQGSPVVRAVIYSSYNPGYATRGTFALGEDEDLAVRPIEFTKGGKPKVQVPKAAKVPEGDLDDFLESLERTVRVEVVEPMARGEVPRTRGSDCSFCPVAWCPERKSDDR